MAEKSEKEKLYWDDASKTIVACTSLASDFFGVTAATLSNWGKEDAAIRFKYGEYDIKAVQAYRGKVAGTTVANNAQSNDPDKMTLQQQKLYYEQKLKSEQADAAVLKNAVSRGEYLPKELVQGDLMRFFVVFKQSLRNLSSVVMEDVASLVTYEEGQGLRIKIDATIDEALMELAIDGVYPMDET